MKKVLSNDGTEIAYEKNGTGPAVILVDGALCFRSFGPMSKLSELLSPHLTVYHYDRRGRGDSGDTQPYAVTREVEDLEALINEAGGSAFVFGTSSGACLALEAAIQLGEKIRKLALYEAPYTSEKSIVSAWKEYTEQLAHLLSKNCRGDAAAAFMRTVGTPDDQIEGMKHSPIWPIFESVAPTLAYDAAVLGEDRSIPAKRAAKVTTRTLVMNGTMIPFMVDTARALANAMPHARHRTLEGQSHDVNLEVLAPILVEFFAGTEK